MSYFVTTVNNDLISKFFTDRLSRKLH